MPDKNTILRFGHLLENYDLMVVIFAQVKVALSEKGLSLKHAIFGDAGLIAAPSSTKNEAMRCDPGLTRSKKGKHWHFGMKARISIDPESGLVYTVNARQPGSLTSR
jgi:IS5 family transposase